MNNPPVPRWQYDEARHVGVDYSDPKIAEEYDASHQKFRDYAKDADLIIGRLGLNNSHVVLDLGCGTGCFVLNAAKTCKKAYAADISAAMLAQLKKNAAEAGLRNIEIHKAGFLTYEHNGDPIDAVVSTFALHHLPDFFKAVALKKIHDMLKPNGKLYLLDVVFSFPIDSGETQLNEWVQNISEKAGEEMAEEAVVHIRDEYSTFDWIIEGILTRTGFEIAGRYDDSPNCIAYVCQKTAEK